MTTESKRKKKDDFITQQKLMEGKTVSF